MKACIALVIALTTPLTAFAWPWGPKTFDECVVAESKEFDRPVSRGELYSIRKVCREKFPETSRVNPSTTKRAPDLQSHQITQWQGFRALSDSEIARITLHAEQDLHHNPKSIKLSAHNGNSHIAVRRIKVRFLYRSKKSSFSPDFSVVSEVEMTIPATNSSSTMASGPNYTLVGQEIVSAIGVMP